MGSPLKCKISKNMTEGRCIKNQIEAEEFFGDRASRCNSCPCDAGLAMRYPPGPVSEEPTPTVEQAAAPVIQEIETTHHKEKTMAIKPRGKCANCERPNMAITNKLGTGICGSCLLVCAGLVGEERALALAIARKKDMGTVKGCGTQRRRNMKNVEAKPEILPQSGAIAPPILTPASVIVEGKSFTAPEAESIHTHDIPFIRVADPTSREQNLVFGRNCITLLFLTPEDQKLLEAIETVAYQFRRTVDQQILWLCQNGIKIHDQLLKEA